MISVTKAVDKFFSSVSKSLDDDPGTNLAIGFCGGRSIKPIFAEILDSTHRLSGSYWKRLGFFLVDERIVSPDSEDSNFRQLSEDFLSPLIDKGLIGSEQCFSLLEDGFDLGRSLEAYSKKLREFDGCFHSAFLGVGEDGHLAGIFPGRVPEDNRLGGNLFYSFDDSPKPPSGRITVSPQTLKRTKNPYLLFFGENKRSPLNKFLDSEVSVQKIPARLLAGEPLLEIVTDLKDFTSPT